MGKTKDSPKKAESLSDSDDEMVIEKVPKKRGRPAKSNDINMAENVNIQSDNDVEDTNDEIPPKTRRRPPNAEDEKKVEKNNNNSNKNTKADGIKKVKKTIVKKNHPKTAEMVAEALITLKNRKGVTLQAIRKYLTNEYNCILTTQIGQLIKKYLGDEFEAGRLQMTNDESDTINYKRRFKVVN